MLGFYLLGNLRAAVAHQHRTGTRHLAGGPAPPGTGPPGTGPPAHGEQAA